MIEKYKPNLTRSPGPFQEHARQESKPAAGEKGGRRHSGPGEAVRDFLGFPRRVAAAWYARWL